MLGNAKTKGAAVQLIDHKEIRSARYLVSLKIRLLGKCKRLWNWRNPSLVPPYAGYVGFSSISSGHSAHFMFYQGKKWSETKVLRERVQSKVDVSGISVAEAHHWPIVRSFIDRIDPVEIGDQLAPTHRSVKFSRCRVDA